MLPHFDSYTSKDCTRTSTSIHCSRTSTPIHQFQSRQPCYMCERTNEQGNGNSFALQLLYVVTFFYCTQYSHHCLRFDPALRLLYINSNLDNHATCVNALMCRATEIASRYSCCMWSHSSIVHNTPIIAYDLIITPEPCLQSNTTEKIKLISNKE